MFSLLLLLACAHTPAVPPAAPASELAGAPAEDYAAFVAAADRTDADRALDDGRHPAALLAAMGVRPGQRVADLMAGGGYTTELLARAVGPTGAVYGQNSKWVLDRFAAAPWAERLARPINANVTRVDRELGEPLGVADLDLVSMVLFYHDSVWLKVDRASMNAAIFAALKPGGRYVVVDHSARAGSGLADVETLPALLAGPRCNAERPRGRGDAPPHRGDGREAGGRGRRLPPRGEPDLPPQRRGRARLERLAREGGRAPRHERPVCVRVREAGEVGGAALGANFVRVGAAGPRGAGMGASGSSHRDRSRPMGGYRRTPVLASR